MLFKSNKIIGLDIGTSSIKMAELERTKNGYVLNSFGFAPTPVGSISAGEIADPIMLADSVKSLMDSLLSKRKNAAVGVWGTSVVIKKISVPRMDLNLLREQVKWEAEQYIPFDINEVSLEYHVLPRSSNPEAMDILIIAARSEYLSRYVEVVETAGLNCSVVDVNSFALANCFEANYGATTETVALINIGASTTNFVVSDRGNVSFVRDIPVGGLTFTNDIHKNMGVSVDEAENLKLSASMGQPVPDEVHENINSSNEVLAEEILRSAGFYNMNAAESPIQRVYVCGGAMHTPNLMASMGKVLNLPVESLNTFAKVRFNTKKFSVDYISQITPFVGVVLGLSMRKAGP